jgi:hypothetical protein
VGAPYQIRRGWLVHVANGYGGHAALGVFFDEDAVDVWRRHGLCVVHEVDALTIGDETFALESPQAFVADAGEQIAEATLNRLLHRQRRALGLEHDAEIAEQEPLPWTTTEANERLALLATVLTTPEAEALGLAEEQETVWDGIMEGERMRQERRRAEIKAHPLIGRVFEAESNAKHRKDGQYVRTHEYVVHAYDGKSGKYSCHAHGQYACLTPGAFGEDLLYSAEEIEAGALSEHRRERGDLNYDAAGHPYVPREREAHARIVRSRKEAV